MSDETRTIFWHEALRHFMEGREPSVLPRFIRPRTFICLWILLGLALLAGVLAWTAQVPAYVSGIAVVTEVDGQITLVVLVSANALEKLSVGQTVLVRWPGEREPARTRIIRVEPDVQSPQVTRQRFGLSSETVKFAVAVATAGTEGLSGTATSDLPIASQLGSTALVDVEIGSRRALSLIWGLGRAIR